MIFQNGFHIPAGLFPIKKSDLIGTRYLLGDRFEFDGRSSDYEHIFRWNDFGAQIWVSEEGSYETIALNDFEPICIALRKDGAVVGFYLDGMAWVDEAHRGKGLAVKMIVSTIAYLQELPNTQDIGYSKSGYSTHMSALKLLRQLAPAPGEDAAIAMMSR